MLPILAIQVRHSKGYVVMKTYATVLIESNGKLATVCGSNGYVQLDGRLSADRALSDAIDHFTKRYPTAKHVAVFKAESLGARGRVIATFPHGRANIYAPLINEGCYK